MKVLSRVIRLRRAILRYGVDTGKPDVRLRGVNGRKKEERICLRRKIGARIPSCTDT